MLVGPTIVKTVAKVGSGGFFFNFARGEKYEKEEG
jgi:hypothetical protein